MDFIPVINELLELKRRMEAEGRKNAEIQDAIRKRLDQAGIRLEKSDEDRIFRFLGVTGWMAWLPAPLVLFRWIWRLLFEATAQRSPAQLAVVAVAAVAAAALTRQAELGSFAGPMADMKATLDGRTKALAEASDARDRLEGELRAATEKFAKDSQAAND